MNEKMLERIILWEINGAAQPPFVCTPEALSDLAVGHLITMGRVETIADIVSIDIAKEKIKVFLHGQDTSACHIGERLTSLSPIVSDYKVALSALKEYADRLMGDEIYFGTHRIMLHSPQGEVFREDIGRHNATDKVIGAAISSGWDFSNSAMGVTGRISLEILMKAASVGIPVLFSKKYPSDLSQTYAEHLQIAIVAKIQSNCPEISGACWRVKGMDVVSVSY